MFQKHRTAPCLVHAVGVAGERPQRHGLRQVPELDGVVPGAAQKELSVHGIAGQAANLPLVLLQAAPARHKAGLMGAWQQGLMASRDCVA